MLGTMPPRFEVIAVADREVTVTNPEKVYFTDAAGAETPVAAALPLMTTAANIGELEMALS